MDRPYKINNQILFLGDISLNDYYSNLYSKEINPFSDISKITKNSDYVVGNLEAVISSHEKVQKDTILSIKKNTLNYLRDLNIKLVTLANNHVLDNGRSGLDETLEFLRNNSIQYIGLGEKYEAKKRFINIENLTIGFLNYLHIGTNPNFPSDLSNIVPLYNKDLIIKDIKEIKLKCDILILIIHWGVENSYFPVPWQRKDAKDFINIGANLVVGHHSHTMQGFEKYKNGLIFYSLGNFAFSPVLKNNKIYELDNNRHLKSIILRVWFGKDGIKFDHIPINNDNQIIKIESYSKIEKLSKLIPLISNPLVWPFYYIYVTKLYKLYFFLWGNNRSAMSQLRKIDLKKIKKYFKSI